MSLHPDAGSPTPGYYLVGNDVTVNDAGYAMVLDGLGVPVWYYEMPAGLGVLDVDSVVPGSVSFVPASNALEDYQVHKLSPLSTVSLAPDGYAPDTHELLALPNGDYLMLSYPQKSGIDLTGLSVITANGTFVPLGPDSTIQDCTVVEFKPSGEVVTTWNASDHFDPVKVCLFTLTGVGPTGTGPDGGTVYDVFHCNSIDVDPANGDLLVSSREMSSIFYIEWPGGRVLWKMGGTNASLDDATYVAVPDPFYFQHDARLQPGWSPACNGGTGQISLFDDESLMTNPARAVVYDVVVGTGADGGPSACDGGRGDAGDAGVATVAWQYKGSEMALAQGSFRITSDGSRVIGWGIGANPTFTEVDLEGNDLLDFLIIDSWSYRAIKVPKGAFDLNVLRATSGGQ
jgi:hypothetical protein